MKYTLIYRQSVAFLLLVGFMAHTFSRSFIVAGYYANKQQYAKNCENKARPQLRCNGKCQMMKKLKQEAQKDEENPERKAENRQETLLLSSKSFFPCLNTPASQEITALKISPFNGGRIVRRASEIFHPPQC